MSVSESEFRLETRKRGTRSELGLGHEKNCYLTLNQAQKTDEKDGPTLALNFPITYLELTSLRLDILPRIYAGEDVK